MQLLSTIILEKDLPSLRLKRGGLGAVVEVYEPDGLEVEFVTASGKTQALVTFTRSDIQAAADMNIFMMRSVEAI